MKSPFIVRRQSLPHPLAEHRWDCIYQLLLRWSGTVEQAQFVPRSYQMEVEDESRNLCPSIDAKVGFLDRAMSEDPHDQLLLQIRGAVAEYERTLITERMRRGRLVKLQAGALLLDA